jgi:hypothetical protein
MTSVLDKFYRFLMGLACVAMVSAFDVILLGVLARRRCSSHCLRR